MDEWMDGINRFEKDGFKKDKHNKIIYCLCGLGPFMENMLKKLAMIPIILKGHK